MDARSTKQVHMFVMVHGLHGTSHDFDFFSQQLLQRFPDAVVLQAQSCSRTLLQTHGGIENLGKEAALEIIEHLKLHPSVERISIIGHSLGGLISRFAVKDLEVAGVFDKVQPVNFVTFASPHLGSQSNLQGLLGTGTLRSLPAMVAPLFLGTTGQQLFMRDVTSPLHGASVGPSPILLQMAHPSFLRPLEAFSHRAVYANLYGDVQVPLLTSLIALSSPFKSAATLPRMAKYPLIIDQDSFDSIDISSAANTQEEVLCFQGLNSLTWKRYAVHSRLLLAHTDIVVKRKMFNSYGRCIVQHAVDHLLY